MRVGRNPEFASPGGQDQPVDQMLCELAARPDLILVTGDKLMLQHKDMAGRELTPLAFCDTWPAS